jgi:hypothetical protein
MPTPTYIALATTTLGSNAATVTFSSIPATYKDLIVVFNGGWINSSNGESIIRFNGDAGANYSRIYALGDGSSTGSGANAGLTEGSWWAMDNSANSNSTLQIMDYSATDKHKTVLSRSNSFPGLYTLMMAGRWASTSAINQISISTFGAGGSVRAGSTISLYGVAA